ncbi:protease PrsW [Halorhabdus sp. CBA1104]|uniref:PrsW family intramembrane metalloprotease n=1 Tax=unclassified Halorhabdus TaxID=2621901 RepID=UPI0012B2B4E6|nr:MULTISPECIES: PrsW family intramembrane metalloprotease [unclassified Halorhabdus]QGN05946.1 protease PrsW [Halorhabdus sp. CBA1104]
MPKRDPIQQSQDGSIDRYDIVEWQPRSWLDHLAIGIHRRLAVLARSIVIVLAVVILATQLLLGGLGTVTDPVVGTLTALSAVPALLLAVYVWRADVTTNEPISLLVSTFLLGVLFAGFAGIVNSIFDPVFLAVGALVGDPFFGLVAMFYLVVGPVEEGVKLLAVRLGAFRDDRFDAVVDGAVYGAVAGLGFATIENAIYITGQTMGEGGLAVLATGGSTATVRALAGPGHVIYSAIAGYYLGLAKFNPDDAGPIVIKGLVVATLMHATYNALVSVVPFALAEALPIGPLAAIVIFVLAFDGLFGYVLLGKLRAYRRAYEATNADQQPALDSELTEFDP